MLLPSLTAQWTSFLFIIAAAITDRTVDTFLFTIADRTVETFLLIIAAAITDLTMDIFSVRHCCYH